MKCIHQGASVADKLVHDSLVAGASLAIAVAIVWWWRSFGQAHYPQAPELLILADGGGSNGYRPWRWKQQLQLKLGVV